MGAGYSAQTGRRRPAYTLTYTVALLGMGALLLPLTASYTFESTTLGRLGLIGYVSAFLGTVMVAGDWWFEAYAMPRIAANAPQTLDLRPSGSVLVGAIVMVVPYTGGWIMFSLAALRAHAFSRAAGLLMLAGGRADGTAGPVDALPDPAGDRHLLGRLHPPVGSSATTRRLIKE